ncbi:MAG: glycoside hydrolase family 1 protein [Anaerolineae bacterium]|nr:glycoside hydrolase family 1 protein [Anaerolineae bacterium]
MPNATYHFPPDFLWGVATASHQVEGNNTNNQWWAWEQDEGHINFGHKSGKACGWWENTDIDFDIAARMGLNAMRLSLEWSRIEPKEGYLDLDAIERYRQMLQGLKQRGIEPMVTLHHFSNPLWLEEYGSWENPDIVMFFNRYTEQVMKHLGDEATLWCTLNEPNVYASQGYVEGIFPPGRSDIKAARQVLRNMVQAHVESYKIIHRIKPEAQVGFAHNYRFFDPARPNNLMDRVASWAYEQAFNRAFLKPLLNGWWHLFLGIGPAPGMGKAVDWIGLNYYTRDLVRFDRTAKDDLYSQRLHAEDAELLDGGYGELYPEGLFRALKILSRKGLPIYITENGTPDSDDDQRPRALVLHLHQMWKALQENIQIRGYYHWTLTDNFEWAEGWGMPFGLIEMDPETKERKTRPSADLYSAIVRGNAITPELIDAYIPEVRPVIMPE